MMEGESCHVFTDAAGSSRGDAELAEEFLELLNWDMLCTMLF